MIVKKNIEIPNCKIVPTVKNCSSSLSVACCLFLADFLLADIKLGTR